MRPTDDLILNVKYIMRDHFSYGLYHESSIKDLAYRIKQMLIHLLRYDVIGQRRHDDFKIFIRILKYGYDFDYMVMLQDADLEASIIYSQPLDPTSTIPRKYQGICSDLPVLPFYKTIDITHRNCFDFELLDKVRNYTKFDSIDQINDKSNIKDLVGSILYYRTGYDFCHCFMIQDDLSVLYFGKTNLNSIYYLEREGVLAFKNHEINFVKDQSHIYA